MEKFRFLDWKVYKDTKILVSTIVNVVDKLPKEYRYELGSQVIRSSFSVLLNIAEGSGKASDKELNRYFEIALGSVYETLAAVDVLQDNNLITQKEFQGLKQLLTEISSQLGGFKKALYSNR